MRGEVNVKVKLVVDICRRMRHISYSIFNINAMSKLDFYIGT